MQRQNRVLLPVIIGVVCIIITLITGLMFHGYMMKSLGGSEADTVSFYERHYALIVDSSDSAFWDKVYEKANVEAKRQDAIVELMECSSFDNNSVLDYIDMAIYEQVDGIFLETIQQEGLDEKINKALEAGIPVIMLLEDAPGSVRTSFIGINSYQMGQEYANEVLKLVHEDTNRIMVLVHGDGESGVSSAILNQVSSLVNKKNVSTNKISIEAYSVNNNSPFETEEAVRNMILDKQGAPDIIICLNEVDTQCVYSAVVDYNKVGKVSIVGYYDSNEEIKEAVGKGIISLEFSTDPEDIGGKCIEAMTEYFMEGRISDYYSINLNTISEE